MLAALCALPASAAARPASDASAVADEAAAASWMFPTERPRHSKWIFAGAYRNATTGGQTVTVAFAVEGTCRDVRRGGDVGTSCHGTGTGGRIPEADFEADPALRGATLVISERRAEHRLEWRADAESPPSGYLAGETCQEGKGAGAGFLQHATASGNVFERDLGAKGVDHAFLARGAMVTDCARALFDRIAAGQPVTVVFR